MPRIAVVKTTVEKHPCQTLTCCPGKTTYEFGGFCEVHALIVVSMQAAYITLSSFRLPVSNGFLTQIKNM